MSCFIVEQETIARIADYIARVYNCGYEFAGFELPRVLREYINRNCAMQWGIAEAELIYNELYQINCKAYNGRYKNEEADYPNYKECSIAKPTEWEEGFRIIEPWHYQMLKHIDCFVYQCDESANRNSELLAGIKLFAAELMRFIIRNTQEYYDAEWR